MFVRGEEVLGCREGALVDRKEYCTNEARAGSSCPYMTSYANVDPAGWGMDSCVGIEKCMDHVHHYKRHLNVQCTFTALLICLALP